MADELPKNVQKKRATMDEPSDGSFKHSLVCPKCQQTMWYLGVKYHKATYATIVDMVDGEPILGDRTTQAPYAYWMCANGHIETDGY